jgi:DNA repair ATPase RecN
MNHPRTATVVVCSVLILTGIGISLARNHMKVNAERRAQRYEQLDQDLNRFIQDMRPLARQLKMGAVCRAVPEEAVSATCTVFDEAETQENQQELEQKLTQLRAFVNDHPRFINSLPAYRQRLIDEMVNLDVDAEVQKLEDEAKQQQEELNDG